MTDVEGDGSSLLSEKVFQDMIKGLDKDGDGSVDKEEYKAAYLKAFPETKDEEYETLWKKIDADGDGNLTVAELAKFYGFNVETGAAAEMDDEDILKMLQLQAAVEEAAPPKEEAKPKAPTAKARDTSIVHIKVGGKYAEESDEAKMAELMRLCSEAPSFLGSLKDILTILAPGEKGEADLTGTKCKLNLRFEDADKQGLLHKLAKVKFNELPDMDKKNTYGACCNTLLACLKVQTAAKGKAMKDDINLQDKYGKTPLYTAVENKNPFLVKELYSQENIKLYEPDPMMANANGWTLMHAAVHAESKDMVELVVNLIGKGRSKLLLQAEDKTGRRPLHIAAYKCDEDTVDFVSKLCVELKVDMNKKDAAGNSPGALAGKTNRRRSREIIDSFAETAKT